VRAEGEPVDGLLGGGGGVGRGQRGAGDEDVGVGGALGRDDVGVVGGRDLVDDADQGAARGVGRLAALLVGVAVQERGGLVWGGQGGVQRGVVIVGGAQGAVREARLLVRQPWEVEGELQGGSDDVDGRERADAAAALEGLAA
jgi:hypothetical protein